MKFPLVHIIVKYDGESEAETLDMNTLTVYDGIEYSGPEFFFD
jgi:hypothetical protein